VAQTEYRTIRDYFMWRHNFHVTEADAIQFERLAYDECAKHGFITTVDYATGQPAFPVGLLDRCIRKDVKK